MGAANLVFGNPAVSALLCFLALNFTIVSFIGCEYVKLHFGIAEDVDRGIYFQNDEWFGLGLFRLQDYLTNKNSRIWEHNATCYDYTTEMDTELFRSTNLSSASNSFLPAVVFSAASLLVLLSLKYKGSGNKTMSGVALLFSFLAFIFQLITFSNATKTSGDAVCSKEVYETWFDTYPMYEYPDMVYMKFFTGCTLGTTGQVALLGIIVQALATVLIGINMYCAKGASEDPVVILPLTSTRGLATSKMVSDKIAADEESPLATLPGDERSDGHSFVTNPSPKAMDAVESEDPSTPVMAPARVPSPVPEVAPVPEPEPITEVAPPAEEPVEDPAPQAAPEPPAADPIPEKFEDDISFAGEGEQDDSPVDDDLSMAPENPTPLPELPPRPSTPVRMSKTLSAGNF